MKNIKENGRSMIEMLGVLAIIGVLSVGGIAGYSKAMHRYRVNKTIEQITQIAGNIRSFFAPQKSYAGLTSDNATGRSLLKKAKLVPDEMWEEGKVYPQNVWGNQVNIGNNGAKGFFMEYYFIPPEACLDIVTTNIADVVRLWTANVGDYYIIPPADLDTAMKFCYTREISSMIFRFDVDATQGNLATYIANTRTAFDAMP